VSHMGPTNTGESALLDRADRIIDLLRALVDAQPRISYTVPQASAMTGTSRTRLYQMAQDGELDKVPDMGTTVLITHTSLVRRFGGEQS